MLKQARAGRWMAAVLAVGVVMAVSAMAEDGAAVKPKKEPKPPVKEKVAELVDVDLTGLLQKNETKSKQGKAVVAYALATADQGEVRLPKGPDGIDMDAMVGQTVRVVGKGMLLVKQDKLFVKQIASIEPVEAAVEE